MSACGLQMASLDAFERRCLDKNFTSPKEIKEKRKEALECPRPIEGQLSLDLAKIHTYQVEHPQMPEWAKSVCKAREFFKDTMLVHNAGEAKHYYRFVYAVLSPIDYLALSKATLIDHW
eukprot:6783166-Lingulodinium_polyedra.AAC.1